MIVGVGSVSAGGKAMVQWAAAEKIALARVPSGTIKEAELEHGNLVRSFDIAEKNSSDTIEVQVDATTGEVVSVEKETPDDEDRETNLGV